MKKLFAVIFASISLLAVKGQDTTNVESLFEDGENKYAPYAFRGTQLINGQTATITPAKTWGFELQHRFGKVGLDSSFVEQFLGLDLPTIMRFGFNWTLGDRMYLEIGRTNYQKTLDMEFKYLAIKQTSDFKKPFSMALYFSSAVRTEAWPKVQPNSYFEDDTTKFVYKPSHRLSYNTQFIFTSRINDRFSVMLTPVFIYHNLAAPYNDNLTFALNAGLSINFGVSSAVTIEYAHMFNNRYGEYFDPLSIGVEFGSAGHIFQVFVSTGSKILEQHLYTESATNPGNAEFQLGFNLQRRFYRK